MKMELKVMEASPHVIDKEGPTLGDKVRRVIMMDNDPKMFCKAFWQMDVEPDHPVKFGDVVEAQYWSTFQSNATVYIKGTLTVAK